MDVSYRKIIYLLFALSILTVLIYYPSLSGGFIHDDHANLVSNDVVKIETLSFTSLRNAATSSSAGRLKRPISMGSFALNYYFFGEDPFSFKVTNLVLHILTGFLVFFLVLTIIKALGPGRTVFSPFGVAAIVSLLWLIHPLHVSTVAYIVQRMAILSTLFSILAILLYLIGRIKSFTNTRASVKYYILCACSFIAGLYSKENAILIPVFILLIETIIFYPQTNSTRYKKSFKLSVTTAVILSIIAIIAFRHELYTYLYDWYYRLREFTLTERLNTQFRIIVYYIKWLIFPNIQELGLFHDDIPTSRSLLSPITTLFSVLFILSLLTLAAYTRNRQPLFTLGILWFFTGHLLESTIIPLEMIYEHRNYLPSVGLILAITSPVIHIFNKYKKLSRYSFHLFGLITLVFSYTTFTRASQWSDTINFAYFEVLHHPQSLRANHMLGMHYKSMAEAGHHEYKEKAYRHLEKASKIGQKRLFSEAALIALADNLNEPAKPEWIDRLAYKLSTPAPRIDDIRLLSDITACTKKACILPTDAAELLFNALEDNPRLDLRNLNHSAYHSARANFILQRGKNPLEAENHFIQAIELNPNNIQNYVDYVNLLVELNRTEEAVSYLDKARKRNRIYENKELLDALEDKVKMKALP